MALFVITICLSLAAIIIAVGTPWQLFSIPLGLFCLYRGRKQAFIINPYYLVMPTFLSYAFYTTKMGRYILTPLSTEGNILIILCISSIIAGFVFIEQLDIKPILNKRYNENFYIILLIGLIPAIASIILVGNPMAMEGEDALDAKSKFTLPLIGQLAYFLQASIVVACKNNQSKKIILSTTVGIIVSLMTLTKTAMLMTALFITVGFIRFKPDILYSSALKPIKKYAWLIIPAILIAGFIFNNAVRKEASGNTRSFISSEKPELISENTDLAQGLYLNYLYFCSSWGNMQYNLNYNHADGAGANTFAQFGKKLGVKVDVVPKKQPSYLNTHSFITDFYLDFGFFGAIVASFVLGCVIFYCYKRFGLSNDALLLSFYALISYATVMLFFSNHFTIGYLLNYFITFGGYYMAMHRFKLK